MKYHKKITGHRHKAATFIGHLAAGMAMLISTGCNGILGNIYDEPSDTTVDGYGFVTPATVTDPGIIYIDATDYAKWTYIDFRSLTATSLDVNAEAPETWDMAIHRYDAKTNGATVAETEATGFRMLEGMAAPSAGSYVADTWTTATIVTDMSTMADGYLGYSESFYNPELSKWLDVDKSSMPPTYTPSGKVYVIRLSDGTSAGVRLANFMDALGVKGYMTIEYMYPLNL